MDSKITNRGFSLYTFRDSYGAYCSIQESSAACDEDGDCKIWFGMDKDAKGVGVGEETTTYDGRVVKLGARMHLTQTQVRDLLPLLTYFVKHGDLPFHEESEDEH